MCKRCDSTRLLLAADPRLIGAYAGIFTLIGLLGMLSLVGLSTTVRWLWGLVRT